ncbi:MAG: PAS-domain containing protein [Elusimicrobia bacterium]|nr:PAS-domain containing protein [Elusimicrobiota bacterium]
MSGGLTQGATALDLLGPLVEAVIDGILVVSEEGKILSFNRRFVEMWGLPDSVLESRSDDAALRWALDKLSSPQEFLARVKRLYAHKDEKSHEEILLKDGRIFDRYSAPIQGSGGIYYGRAWCFRDVTEKKKLEKMIFQSEKMAAVGQLAGGIAHELNNPLTGILATTQLVLADLGDDSGQLKEDLKAIEEAAQRCRRIVTNLLGFSRSNLLSLGPVSFFNCLKHVLDLLTNEAALNKTALINKVDPGIPPVLASAIELEQVLTNLILNSIQAMPQGGAVTISSRLLDQGRLLVEIEDAGTGIAREHLSRIFEPFFTTKATGKGTGLGLAISSRILQQFRGNLAIESSGSGKGTKARIELMVFDHKPQNSAEAGQPR